MGVGLCRVCLTKAGGSGALYRSRAEGEGRVSTDKRQDGVRPGEKLGRF